MILHKNVKKVLYDSIPEGKGRLIAINSGMMVGTHFLLFYSVSALPLVEVSLVINLIPLCTAVLGYIILKDRLTWFEVMCLMVAFTGVTVLVIGSQTDAAEETGSSSSIFSYIVVCMCCLSIASIAIIQRNLKGVNPWVTPFYLGLLGVIVFNSISLGVYLISGDFYPAVV